MQDYYNIQYMRKGGLSLLGGTSFEFLSKEISKKAARKGVEAVGKRMAKSNPELAKGIAKFLNGELDEAKTKELQKAAKEVLEKTPEYISRKKGVQTAQRYRKQAQSNATKRTENAQSAMNYRKQAQSASLARKKDVEHALRYRKQAQELLEKQKSTQSKSKVSDKLNDVKEKTLSKWDRAKQVVSKHPFLLTVTGATALSGTGREYLGKALHYWNTPVDKWFDPQDNTKQQKIQLSDGSFVEGEIGPNGVIKVKKPKSDAIDSLIQDAQATQESASQQVPEVDYSSINDLFDEDQ